ncbi:MAG: helix-turn-helix transcriptional regulator [Erysipelotrichaceae bacterium]
MERIREFELLKILLENTDSQHSITKNEILALMQDAGFSLSDDTLSKYIKQFELYGYNVEVTMGRNATYRLVKRTFLKEEIKLIVDAINASNFIENETADQFKSKLSHFISRYEVDELRRNVQSITVAKTENKKILNNVEKIQKAINQDKCISFNYLTYNENMELVNKSERTYTLSPFTALWAYDRYYLFGYDTVETTGSYLQRCYRVDKLSNIKILDQPRVGYKQFESFNANKFVSRRVCMYGGQEEKVTLKIHKDLISPLVDQFGKYIDVKHTDEPDTLIVSFNVVASDLFLGWLIGLHDVEVLSPASVRQQMIKLIEKNAEKY